MSVMVLDPKVYEYVLNGLLMTAQNTTCNEFYAYKTKRHFEDKDIYKEAGRLIKSWAKLNELSFNVAYNEKGLTTHKEIRLAAIWKVEAIQLLKYLEAISYNIEIETIELGNSYRRGPVENAPGLPGNAKADYEFLNNWIIDLMCAIIHKTDAYDKAKWSDPVSEQPLQFN